MLSPGDYHLSVPREPEANLRLRLHVVRRCREEPAYRAALVELCRRDILLYVNLFVVQHNPNSIGAGSAELGPFVTWPFQDAAVRTVLAAVEEREDLLIEKSREMGASWLCLIVMDWLCLFHGWKKLFAMSHTEDAVDKPGDPDALFWKVEFMHRHLPDWLRRGAAKQKLAFTFPATNSSMTGAATTERSGVGGRAYAAFLDEFSKHRAAHAILGQTADTTRCRIINGTHYGVGTAFYQLSQRPDIRRLVMHWSQHPDKRPGLYRFDPQTQRVEVIDTAYRYPPDFQFVTDGTPAGGPFPGLRSPWYDAECRRRASSRDVAMNLDIDPKGSVSQFFDPLMVAQLRQRAWEPLWEGDLDHDRETAEPFALVPAAGGPLRLWLHPTPDGKVPADEYCAGGDVAAGTGATCSCLSILRKRTGEKVAEYRSPHVSPEKAAALWVALCRLFADRDGRGAYFVWEAAGPGLKLGKTVVELGYRHIHYKTEEFDMRKRVSERPGWYPLPNSKRVLLEDYRAALSSGKFTNPSALALEDCLAFKYDASGEVVHAQEASTDDPSGARVNHADLVIADALAWIGAKGEQLPRRAKPVDEVPVGSMAWRRELSGRNRELAEVWG